MFRGVQLAADYTVPLSATVGSLVVGANVQHIVKQYSVIEAGSAPTNTRGNIGSSIDQANLRLTFDHGPVSWFNEIRYIGPAVFDATEPPGTRDVQGVSSYVVWNTSIAFNIDKRATFQINVDDVTNRGVPYPGSGNATQNIYTTGLFGRTFRARFAVHY